jgi:hypothetical protein
MESEHVREAYVGALSWAAETDAAISAVVSKSG